MTADRSRPDRRRARLQGAFLALALAVAVGLAAAASPFASSSPDGLERVAEDKGFLDRGELHAVQEVAPVPDYAMPGVDDPRLATGLAGFAGTLLVFAVGYGLARVVHARPPARRDRAAAGGA